MPANKDFINKVIDHLINKAKEFGAKFDDNNKSFILRNNTYTSQGTFNKEKAFFGFI